MTLTVDSEVTIAEIVVILIGIAITWAVYRGGGGGRPPAAAAPSSCEEPPQRPPGPREA